MSRILSIGTAVPEHQMNQGQILDFMHEAYQDITASRKLNLLFHNSGIKTRYSVVSDFKNSKTEHILFNGDQPPDVEERLNVYKEQAVALAMMAIRNSLLKLNTTITDFGITHLITVTCTGIYSPGLDTELMEKLNLPDDIFHIPINFIGCNAAFPALKLADMIAKTDENAKVLIVCVELCTLHFQPKENDDNLLSNTIFGDGAAAAIVISDTAAKQGFHKGISIIGFYSLLLNKGKDLMKWNITPVNFEMDLDARIPEFIGDEMNEIVTRTGIKLNFRLSGIDKWAVHPGGKKILDTVKKQLQLKHSDLQHSYKVLEEYGNMSSPTILFVLNEIMHFEHKPNETIFSIGFGPGLSIETALFTYAE